MSLGHLIFPQAKKCSKVDDSFQKDTRINSKGLPTRQIWASKEIVTANNYNILEKIFKAQGLGSTQNCRSGKEIERQRQKDRCQPINAEGMLEVENHHFASP